MRIFIFVVVAFIHSVAKGALATVGFSPELGDVGRHVVTVQKLTLNCDCGSSSEPRTMLFQ